MSSILDFTQDYVLENDAVRLQPLKPEDEQFLLPFSLYEPELWTYSLIQASGAAALKNYIQLAFEGKELKKEYPFLVFDKRTQKFAGSTRFYDIQLHNKTLQLGYTWYGKEFQGTGLNKNCKFLLLQFAFETLNMERVEFRADANNQRSIAAMKSIGCTEEGILRSNCPTHDGKRRDSIVLSILKHEWETSVKALLLRILDA